MLGQAEWKSFEAAFNVVGKEAFFNKAIIWKKTLNRLSRYMEDGDVPTHEEVPLKCLINTNYLRSWPATVAMEAGNVDKQSIQVIFLKQDFVDLGKVTTAGYPDLDTERDRFIIDGLEYSNAGDTLASQTYNNDLLVVIIMRREEIPTGKKRGDA